ncbi:MAG TPA: hypothetical protein VFB34_13430 [Chloroflexota bacterium]|nr:hypothetical protein [Chloroflexota bacterium]
MRATAAYCVRMVGLLLPLVGGVVAVTPAHSGGISIVPGRWRAFVLSADRTNKTGQPLAVDGRNGSALACRPLSYFAAVDSPDMLVSPIGRRLYLASRVKTSSGRLTEGVSVFDAASLRRMAVAIVPHRIRYLGQRYSTMTLSPDGSKLFVYVTGISRLTCTAFVSSMQGTFIATHGGRSCRVAGPNEWPPQPDLFSSYVRSPRPCTS